MSGLPAAAFSSCATASGSAPPAPGGFSAASRVASACRIRPNAAMRRATTSSSPTRRPACPSRAQGTPRRVRAGSPRPRPRATGRVRAWSGGRRVRNSSPRSPLAQTKVRTRAETPAEANQPSSLVGKAPDRHLGANKPVGPDQVLDCDDAGVERLLRPLVAIGRNRGERKFEHISRPNSASRSAQDHPRTWSACTACAIWSIGGRPPHCGMSRVIARAR